MNKNLYPWLIFFLGLSAASSLLQSIIQFLIGSQFFMLDSFDVWFLIMNISALIGGVLLLRYYDCQKYWLTFATGILYLVCACFYALLFYAILRFPKFGNYNIPMLFLFMVSGILYSISLIFLRAEKARWLKTAGVYLLIIGSIFLTSLIWVIINPSFANKNRIERISQWTTLASCLIPVFFMIHFFRGLRRSGTDGSNAAAGKSSENWVGLAGFLCFVFTLVLGIMVSTECYSSIHWSNSNYQRTKDLAQLGHPGALVNRKGDILHYQLIKPLDYDPSKKYPIVISLPYGGQPATDTIKQIEGAVMALLLTTDGNRRNYPAFIFIPNCPPGAGWGGIPGYPNVDSLVFDAVIALDRQFSIDEKRRYVAGLSRGGFGAWNFVCKRPEMFAAAIPVSGGGDPGLAPRAVRVAVWAFHGARDRNVSVINSRNMINAIKKAGGNPGYTE